MIKLRLLLVLMSCAGFLYAQELPVPSEINRAYKQGTRSTNGQPGKNYWQNTADYNLKINFNPASRLLNGQVEITYYNHSPDTLKQIWLKLYPNLFKKGVKRKSRIAISDQSEGVKLTQFKMGSVLLSEDQYLIDGTNLSATIKPLLPGKELKISLKYSYTLNKGSHTRTGQVDEGSYFIAYFFPRVAVYDDIDGWNKYPYTGDEEFYNDFSNFKAEITVPKDQVVWATGNLLNVKQVFTSPIAQRLALAEKVDTVVNIISAEDLARGVVTQPSKNTFKFEADNVTDFAFALSDHYLWKSTSVLVDSNTLRRSRVDAAFNPAHKDYYEVIDFARQSVYAMSHVFPKWPYPYAHETIFDGLDQMEYPMMVNDNPVKRREDAITLTIHEIFHTMFPFYMGTNETKYAWMDEGWATIGEWKIGPMIDTNMVDTYGVDQTASSSGRKDDTPIMTLSPDLTGAGIFTNSYPKPAMSYLYVQDYLGPQQFTKALHHYINTWKGKHPMPFDFFNCINESAGKNLNWFWKRWFFEGGITDMAINRVLKNNSGYQINILNKSSKPLPVDLKLVFTDGSIEKIHRNIGVWEMNNTNINIDIQTNKVLKRVMLGDAHTPDKNKNDNIFNL